jgi:glycosyltransferase involved in cell wall biosynthesis
MLNKYYPDVKLDILPFGIPDLCDGERKKHGKKDKLVFAIIGGLWPRKAQDIFVKAIKMLDSQYKDKAEFWIIGMYAENWYYYEICRLIQGEDNIKILGEMTREEIYKAYKDIDVVVCASLQETFSIVITEAMMYGKPSITTDSTGVADFIQDGKNGLICKTGDAADLSEKLQWMLLHQDLLDEMGNNARKTYEEYFTMEKFADRLEDVLNKKFE